MSFFLVMNEVSGIMTGGRQSDIFGSFTFTSFMLHDQCCVPLCLFVNFNMVPRTLSLVYCEHAAMSCHA